MEDSFQHTNASQNNNTLDYQQWLIQLAIQQTLQQSVIFAGIMQPGQCKQGQYSSPLPPYRLLTDPKQKEKCQNMDKIMKNYLPKDSLQEKCIDNICSGIKNQFSIQNQYFMSVEKGKLIKQEQLINQVEKHQHYQSIDSEFMCYKNSELIHQLSLKSFRTYFKKDVQMLKRLLLMTECPQYFQDIIQQTKKMAANMITTEKNQVLSCFHKVYHQYAQLYCKNNDENIQLFSVDKQQLKCILLKGIEKTCFAIIPSTRLYGLNAQGIIILNCQQVMIQINRYNIQSIWNTSIPQQIKMIAVGFLVVVLLHELAHFMVRYQNKFGIQFDSSFEFKKNKTKLKASNKIDIENHKFSLNMQQSINDFVKLDEIKYKKFKDIIKMNKSIEQIQKIYNDASQIVFQYMMTFIYKTIMEMKIDKQLNSRKYKNNIIINNFIDSLSLYISVNEIKKERLKALLSFEFSFQQISFLVSRKQHIQQYFKKFQKKQNWEQILEIIIQKQQQICNNYKSLNINLSQIILRFKQDIYQQEEHFDPSQANTIVELVDNLITQVTFSIHKYYYRRIKQSLGLKINFAINILLVDQFYNFLQRIYRDKQNQIPKNLIGSKSYQLGWILQRKLFPKLNKKINTPTRIYIFKSDYLKIKEISQGTSYEFNQIGTSQNKLNTHMNKLPMRFQSNQKQQYKIQISNFQCLH